jgi:hypothetical protein
MAALKRPDRNPYQPPSDTDQKTPSSNPSPKKGPFIVKVDATTLITTVIILLLLPLLLTGFFSH